LYIKPTSKYTTPFLILPPHQIPSPSPSPSPPPPKDPPTPNPSHVQETSQPVVSSFWLVNPRREVTVHEVKEKRGGWGVCGFEFTVLYGGILFIELQYLATRLINKPTD